MGRGRRSAGDWGVLYPAPRAQARAGATAERLQILWEQHAIKAGVIVAGAWCVMANARPLWEAIVGMFR